MTDYKNIDSFWSIADPLTVEQTAALLVGIDPNQIRTDFIFTGYLGCDCTFQTALAVLQNAIKGGILKAILQYDAKPRYIAGVDNFIERSFWIGEDVQEIIDQKNACYLIKKAPNLEESFIYRKDLMTWLISNGITSGYFFPDSTDSTDSTYVSDYLNPKHPRYSPKLAAAIYVWLIMDDENLIRGKNPLSAMMIYLTSNYQELGLFHEKDNPKNGTVAGGINKTAISEVAKIANWQPSGGAPKTPGG